MTEQISTGTAKKRNLHIGIGVGIGILAVLLIAGSLLLSGTFKFVSQVQSDLVEPGEGVGPDLSSLESILDQSDLTDNSESSALFDGTAVSDEEIKGVRTYADFLEVYQKVVDNFSDNFKTELDYLPMLDPSMLDNLKDKFTEGMSSKLDEYEAQKTEVIPDEEKAILVKNLISARNLLHNGLNKIKTLSGQ